MISRIEGELVLVVKGRAELRCGPVTYELLIPAADDDRLAGQVGQAVTFHTLHYLESQAQGAAYLPRLIGFESAEARGFFEMLTSVKGLGPRKTLRAMAMPHTGIAEAIADGDVTALTRLPEIGRRIAETIVTQLRGKVAGFIEVKPDSTAASAGRPSESVADAIATLTKLGEPQAHAQRLIELAMRERPAPQTADELVSAALRLKNG